MKTIPHYFNLPFTDGKNGGREFLLLCFLFLWPVEIWAANDRSVEISATGGYQFGGRLTYADGEASVAGGPSFGGILGWQVNPHALALVSYHHQLTSVEVRPAHAGWTEETDLNVGYLQIGGELQFPTGTRLVSFFGLTIGGSVFTAQQSGETAADWYFAAVLYGGVKIPFSQFIGIRSQVRLLTTIVNNESNWLCVTGKGCHVLLDVEPFFQGEISAGLYLAF